MRQVYITTGFPIIIGYYCCIQARTRKKRTEIEREKRKIVLVFLGATNTYTHYSSSIRCWFFLSSVCMLKRIRESVTAFFFFFVHVLWDNRACLSSFLPSIRERKREKKPRNSQNNTTAIAVVFVIMLVSNEKQRGKERKMVSRKQLLGV
jgi:hypothetical protein